jgi:hypothetical protein
MAFVAPQVKLSRLLWLLLLPAFAQPQPDLVIRLHDAQQAPLPGLAVEIRAGAGGPPLATETTDVSGTAVFMDLPVDRVAVIVRGSLPDGTHLALPGQDAAGIAVLLGPPPTRLDLRVARDGTLLPDPAMLAEPAASTPGGGPTAVAPAVIPSSLPSASPLPTRPADDRTAQLEPPLQPTPLSPGAANAAPTTPTSASRVGWVIGIVLLLGGLVTAWVVRRRSS